MSKYKFKFEDLAILSTFICKTPQDYVDRTVFYLITEAMRSHGKVKLDISAVIDNVIGMYGIYFTDEHGAKWIFEAIDYPKIFSD